ncbi:MAG: hypothetical protein E7620_08560 [Ruminococcaceae bacterium]|nr:hypothetical protein [Oscillospiraceae bacterium]
MKKSIFTKAIVALMVIALMLPCFPVIASAETPTVTTYTVTDADKAWYGDGSETEFTISTVGELAYFMELGMGSSPKNFLNKTVKLGADIVWNDGVATSAGFTPSAEQGNVIYKWVPYSSQIAASSWLNFRGTFDGQGHTISGLYVAGETSYLGFLGTIRGGKVKNLTVSNSYYEIPASKQYVGAVVGGFYGAGNEFTNVTVSNCHINATKGMQSSNAGGICGGDAAAKAGSSFTNCVVDSKTTITGKAAMGGIVGSGRTDSTTTMTDCASYATLSGTAEIGGLMGRVAGKTTFTRCLGLAQITASSGAAWGGALASLRYNNNGTQAAAVTAESGCVAVIFEDCFYAAHSNASVKEPVAMVAMASGSYPAHKVVIRYSDVQDDVSSVAYYKDSQTTVNAETGGLKSMPALAAAVTEQFSAYKDGAAALAIPAKGTDAVKVAGVQIKKNDTTFAARFLATVNTAEIENLSAVKSVGFQVSILSDYAKNGASAVKQQDCGAVYTSILSDYGMKTVTAAEMSADYVGTLVIDKIPATGIQHVLVRAYYTTDGDAVSYSEAAVFTFVNGAFAGSAFLSTTNSDSTQAA